MATLTLRLPDPLKARASDYADSLGISFTALVAVALKDYLDARDGQAPVQIDPLPAPEPEPVDPPPAPEPVAVDPPPAAPEVKPVAQSKQKVGRNAPCPCGSGLKYKVCCGP